jgi:Uri superfamily endonuclease
MAIYGPETLNVLRVALDEAWNNLPRFKQKHRKRKWHLEFLNAQQRANDAVRLRTAALLKLAK